MKDKLKQFVDENREAFDSENPDPAVLARLQRRLNEPEKRAKFASLFPFRNTAAAVLLVMLITLTYFIFQRTNTNKPVVSKEVPTVEDPASIVDPVYAKQIDHYQELIGLQQTELKKLQADHPDLYRQFSSDINRLDSAYQSLKTTLDENPNTEVLLEAMLQNLQLQSDLLNRQLRIIKEIKQKSKT